MNNGRLAIVCAVLLCLLSSACGSPVSPGPAPKREAAAGGTPPAIPSCEHPSFKLLTQIEGRKDRVRLSAASKHAAFFAAYYQGGRIKSDGAVEQITFDDYPDPAILGVSALSNDQAWFLRREPWFFDGTNATRVPVPEGISVDSLSVGGSEVWVGGKEGDEPAILRRKGEGWERIPFTIPRFEHLSIMLGADAVPYLTVVQVVPKPKPPPGQVQTMELRTETSLWTRNGSDWEEITPEKQLFGVVPGGDGVLYAFGGEIQVQRYFGGAWAPIPLAQPEAAATGEHALSLGAAVDLAGRLWITGVRTFTTAESSGQSPGMWLLDGDVIRQVPLVGDLKSVSEVSSVSVAPDGSIWLVADERVYRGTCD
jgi:hypothetical protein